ncbi:hypothetical protein [Nitrosomonas marina]|uniref:Uncharacterized protein n=1 Tax=Nitrosomonas marina TaxID=917 RepID=A0A1H8AKX8_9PROT|nr:hypothetical protein [Nitrosomonas marina]SEM71415.1 hypothetical protein SAMN05216325_101210 [Nitrosomonas marina]
MMQAYNQRKQIKPASASVPVRRSGPQSRLRHSESLQSLLRKQRTQSKIRIGQPNDRYDQGADHTAAQAVQQEQNSAVVSSIIGTIIQRQHQSGPTKSENNAPSASVPAPRNGSTYTSRCHASPEFPDFPCLVSALKLDVDDNLRVNAHRFYRVASLYPGDDDLMWDTFLRYGLGVNLLQTGFGFFGTNETLSSVLSYGTGGGLKAYNFFQNGVLELDIPVSLGNGLNLDFQLDLTADPDNLTDVRQVSAGVGLSGHF